MSTAESHLNGWLTASLRLTAMYQGPADTRHASLREAFGISPEERVEKGERTSETGIWGGGQLQLITQPGRVDWVLSAIEQEESPRLSLLGRVGSELPRFVNAARGWLGGETGVQRLALGAILFCRGPSREEAYAVLTDSLPQVRIGPNDRDLIYQVNRQVPTAIDGVHVNRLGKWSAIELMRFAIRSSKVENASSGEFYARLELDINSAAEFAGSFAPAQLDLLLASLQQGLLEVARTEEQQR